MQLLLFIYSAITRHCSHWIPSLRYWQLLFASALPVSLSPSPALFFLCYSLLVCLSRCPTVCHCICLCLCVCVCSLSKCIVLAKYLGHFCCRCSVLTSWTEAWQPKRRVRGGLLFYFFIDLTVQASRQRRHNLSSHCLRHMFDVYKFNLIYLNNYLSFATNSARQGAAQKQSQSEIAIDGRTMQTESGGG